MNSILEYVVLIYAITLAFAPMVALLVHDMRKKR